LLRFLAGVAMLALALTAPTLNQAAASAPAVGASALNPVAEGASNAARLVVPIDTDISEKSGSALSAENPARATAGALSATAAGTLHTQLAIAATARTSTEISEKSGNEALGRATTLALACVALRITAQRAPPAI
jgi:hypothetical protein